MRFIARCDVTEMLVAHISALPAVSVLMMGHVGTSGVSRAYDHVLSDRICSTPEYARDYAEGLLLFPQVFKPSSMSARKEERIVREPVWMHVGGRRVCILDAENPGGDAIEGTPDRYALQLGMIHYVTDQKQLLDMCR